MKIQIVLVCTAALALAATASLAKPESAPSKPDCCKSKSACCPSGACCTASAQKYTCEMHPEVVSDKPGKCPKCGMNLVPVQPSQK